jgi:acyl-CoA reductase-like NAD-dependent aldehyde dehydrogenase
MAVAEATKTYGLWLAGEERQAAAGETFETRNPATGEVIGVVAQGSAADVDAAVAAAQSAMTGAWAKFSPTKRSKVLHKLADLILANMDELAELETRNNGKAISSVKAEIHGATEVFRFFAAGLAGHAGTALPLGGSLLSYTLKEPVGVCAQIIPWNYPFMMASWKLAPALAAGCAVVMKPATATPLTCLRLAQLASEAGIPEGVVNVIPGPGGTLGDALVTHPGIAKVAFTGATDTGQTIMRQAAAGLKRLTLELGGKSPSIVFGDADLTSAIPSSVWSIFYSAGQSCEARSRILVERSIHDAFVERFVELTGKLNVGDPLDPATQIGSLISEAQLNTVHGYVESGTSEGATVALGGSRLSDGALANGSFYSPTVLTGVENSMRVAQEEIFGPVVTIIPFEDEKEAIRLANDVEFGLMGTVWTNDTARAHRVAARVQSGLVGINMPYTAMPGVPFGGYKHSGFGRELSLESLDAYTETKGVIVNVGSRPIDPFGLTK